MRNQLNLSVRNIKISQCGNKKISEKVATIPTWDELATYYPAKLLDDEDDQVLEKVHSKEQKPNCDLAFLIVIGTSIIVISLMLLVYLIKCKT